MALETATLRTQGTTTDVYTVPAGMTARLVACSIANTSSPVADDEITIQVEDASASATYNLLTAGEIYSNEQILPLQKDLTLSAGDTFKVTPARGRADVVVTFDLDVEPLISAGFQLSHSTDTVLAGVDTGGTRIAYLSFSNSGDSPEAMTLTFVDSSPAGTSLIASRLLVIPGTIYYPLFGTLGLGTGDRLRARGSGTASNLTAFVTTEPQTTLTTAGYDLAATTYTNIATAVGTVRISFFSICNTGTASENCSIQVVDQSRSAATVAFEMDVAVPPGITAYPITGDFALQAGDILQAKGSGTTSNLVAVVTVDSA